MRRMNVPPLRRAHSQLNSAVRAPPMWRYPVGDGANRTRGLSMAGGTYHSYTRRMRRWLAAVLLALAAPAGAAIFAAMSVEEMARSSDAVVRGLVISREARLTSDQRIVTEVEIAVASAWKGEPEGIVRVVVPGGSLGWIALAVDAAATFEDGEEVVVFLARNGRGYSVAGHALGKYAVAGEEARPALGAAQVLPRTLAAGERLVEAMSVAELERRVRSAR